MSIKFQLDFKSDTRIWFLIQLSAFIFQTAFIAFWNHILRLQRMNHESKIALSEFNNQREEKQKNPNNKEDDRKIDLDSEGLAFGGQARSNVEQMVSIFA